jgi:hypothetical protein
MEFRGGAGQGGLPRPWRDCLCVGTTICTVSRFVGYFAVHKANTLPVLGGPTGLARRAAVEQACFERTVDDDRPESICARLRCAAIDLEAGACRSGQRIERREITVPPGSKAAQCFFRQARAASPLGVGPPRLACNRAQHVQQVR